MTTCTICGAPFTAQRARATCSDACLTELHRRNSNHRADLVEDVEWMLDGGDTPTQILTRLATTPTAIARRLYRAGRPDLARLFNPTSVANRKRPCLDCGAPVHHKSARCRPCAICARSADPEYRRAFLAGMAQRAKAGAA